MTAHGWQKFFPGKYGALYWLCIYYWAYAVFGHKLFSHGLEIIATAQLSAIIFFTTLE